MVVFLSNLRLVLTRVLVFGLAASDASQGPLNYTWLGRYALDGPAGRTVTMAGPSTATHCQIDRHDPNVGWPGYSRPNGTKHTSDAVFMPATALPGGRVACHMSDSDFPMVTAGNATLSVLVGGCSQAVCEHVPSPACCTNISAYVELFALFEVQFGRRPYFWEAEGSLVVLTDPSLRGQHQLRLRASLPGGVEIDALLPGGRKWRVPFSMAHIPPQTNEAIDITLQVGGDHVITQRRRFVRHPPPPQDSAITAFQLDHEHGGALRASGASFLSQGWFNGGAQACFPLRLPLAILTNSYWRRAGYNHQVDDLGAKFFAQKLGAAEPNWYARQSLNLGSIAQHWGARGLNFVRFQSQVFTDWSSHTSKEVQQQQLAAFKLYLDECAMAGVYVLLDSNIDPIAIQGFNGTNGTEWQELLGNLSLVNRHPGKISFAWVDAYSPSFILIS